MAPNLVAERLWSVSHFQQRRDFYRPEPPLFQRFFGRQIALEPTAADCHSPAARSQAVTEIEGRNRFRPQAENP